MFKDSRERALNTNPQTTTILRKGLEIKSYIVNFIILEKHILFLRKDFIVNTKLYQHNIIKREGWKNIGKHGHDIKWVAPASNAARRTRDATALASDHVFFFFFFFFSTDSRWRSLNSGQFRPYRVKPADSETVDSGRNSKKKKKKKVQNAPFELNNIPYFSSLAHFIQTPSSLTLSHSISHLSLSLCSRLSAFVSALRLPCGYETLSQTATQSLQTPKFSSLSILWVVFNL